MIDHVLLIGFGGPEKKEDILPFLENVTRGRNIPKERLQEVAHHYEVIGGFSPYNPYTFQLRNALEKALQSSGIQLPVYVGMRNWDPYLKNTLQEIRSKNHQNGIALILAPHRSEVSYERYIQNVYDAMAEGNVKGLQYFLVDPWHQHPQFIQAQSEQIRKVVPDGQRNEEGIHYVFSAHSIPYTMASKCAYEQDFKASSELVSKHLQIQSWSCCFQSRSGNPYDAWLEPDIGDHLKKLKASGVRKVVVVPIGFLCDNAEVLFDLDVEAKQIAQEIGVDYLRASTVMDHPAFVQMWMDLIRKVSIEKPEEKFKMNQPAAPEFQPVDILEKGAPKDGKPQTSNRRLYFQLQCVHGRVSSESLDKELKNSKLDYVLYRDMNDPYGHGIVLMAENPEIFVQAGRKFFESKVFKEVELKQEMTMVGRTYSMGREPDLDDWMLNKYRRNALNGKYPWAVWYPLRRKPEFALLTREEQGKILMEHAQLGQVYGMSGFAFDIRLACYGIDKQDNEFVIGLVGEELYPLSRLIQDMRKTQQTSKYIQSLGPFFVGHVFSRSTYRDIR